MIIRNDGKNPTGQNGYSSILGGIGSDSDTYMLSAYYLTPYAYEEVSNPKWWQFWRESTFTIIESQRWERHSCMLYQWQLNCLNLTDFDFEKNEKLQTLLFVLGGGSQHIYGVELSNTTQPANYIEISEDFTKSEWKQSTSSITQE